MDIRQALLDLHEMVAFEPWFKALRAEAVGTTLGRDPTPYLNGHRLRLEAPRTRNADQQGLGLILYVQGHTSDSTAFVKTGFRGFPVVVKKA